MSDSSVDDRTKDTTLVQEGDRGRIEALHTITTEAEALYRLEFDLALRAEGEGTKHAIQVYWNDTLVGTATASGAGTEHFSFELVGTGKEDQLRFDVGGGTDGDLLLDNVRLSNGEQSLSLAAGGFTEPDTGADDGTQAGSQESEEGKPLTVETTAGTEPQAATMDMVKRTDAAISSMVTPSEGAVTSQSGDPGPSDTQRGDDDANVMIGGSGADKLHGTGGSDRLDGGAGDDVLRGGRGNDELLGGAGDDMLRGRRGADTLAGGAGDDTLHGGSGRDVAEFSGNRADYRITPVEGGGLLVEDVRAGAPDGKDTLHKVEQLRFADGTVTVSDLAAGGGSGGAGGGTDAGDVIRGDAKDNVLAGGPGDDRLHGTLGADTLDGGAGYDTLRGGAGDDRLDGGPDGDTLLGRAGADVLTGGDYDDLIDGGPGMDTAVFGGNRADYRITDVEGGGLRIEDLRPGSPDGDDKLYRVEQLRFADGTVAVTDLGAGDGSGGGDGRGTDAGDVIRGDAEANVLSGGAGDDRLHGTPGDDKLDGSAGDDVLRGGVGRDEVVGGTGDDQLHGRSGADTLTGGAGDDMTVGGPGMDKAVFAGNRADYRITAVEGGGMRVEDLRPGSPDGDDRLHKVEQLRFADGEVAVADLVQVDDGRSGSGGSGGGDGGGTDAGNVIRGDAAANELSGGAGDDRLHGTPGDDKLDGGAGDDLVRGGRGKDEIVGGAGDDALHGRSGADTLTGGAGDDAIVGGPGMDIAVFGGNRVDYRVTPVEGSGLLVEDLRAGAPDGKDTLHKVEQLRFTNGEVAVADLVLDGDGPITTTASVEENVRGASVGAIAGGGDAAEHMVDDARFAIVDGKLALKADQSLDHESSPLVTVKVTSAPSGDSPVEQIFTIAVADVDEAPVVTAIAPITLDEEATPIPIDLLAGAVDPEAGDLDVARVTIIADDGRPVAFTVDGETGTLTIDPGQFDALGLGRTLALGVRFDAVDEGGAVTSNTGTVVVTGSNDAPVVAAIAPTAVSEAQPPVTLDLLAGALDPDSCDLDVASVTLTASDGRPVTFTLDPENGALGLDPRQFDDLGQGQILTLDVAFNVVDSAGASTASTARITVTGSGDGPPNVVCGGTGGSSGTEGGQDESGAGGGGGTPGGQAEIGAEGASSDQGQSGSGGTPGGQGQSGAGSGGDTPGGQAESGAGGAGGTPSGQGQSGASDGGGAGVGQAETGTNSDGGTPGGQAETGSGGADGTPSGQGQGGTSGVGGTGVGQAETGTSSDGGTPGGQAETGSGGAGGTPSGQGQSGASGGGGAGVGQAETGTNSDGGTPGGQAETGSGGADGTPSGQGQGGTSGVGGTGVGQAETGTSSDGGTPGGQAETGSGGAGGTPSGQGQGGASGGGGTQIGQAESGSGGGTPGGQAESGVGGTPGGQDGFVGFPGSGTSGGKGGTGKGGGSHGGGSKGGSHEGLAGFPDSGTGGGKGGTGKGGGSHGGGSKGGSHEGFAGFPNSGTSGGKGGTGKGGGSHGSGSKGGNHEGFVGFPDSGTGGGKGGTGKGGGSHGGGGKGGSHEGLVGFPDSGTGGGKGGTGKGGGSHGGGSKGGSHEGFVGFPGTGTAGGSKGGGSKGGGSKGGGSKGGNDHGSSDFPPRCGGGITLAEDGPVTIRFESEGAGYRNGFGLYRIDTETGAIHDVQLVWSNASAAGGGGELIPGQSEATIDGAAGDRLGFFIVENGAGQLEGLDLARGSFVFVDPMGAQATIDGATPQLWFAAPGAAPIQIQDNVYHTLAPGEGANLNPDGIDHARMALDVEQGRMSLAFEDLPHGGDQDFDDVVVSIDLGAATATALTGLFDEAVEATLPATLPATEHADFCTILAPDEIPAGPLAVEDLPLVIVAEEPDFFATALDCEVAPPSGPGHVGGEPGGSSDPVLPPPEPEDSHVAHEHHHGGHHGHGC